jgi:hypothetical protein
MNAVDTARLDRSAFQIGSLDDDFEERENAARSAKDHSLRSWLRKAR